MNPRVVAGFSYPHAGSIPISKLRIGGTLSLEISPALLDLAARSKTKRFPWRRATVEEILSR